MYKYSFYNFNIPIPEKKLSLLYNSLTGGLIELNYDEQQLVDSISKKDRFSKEEYPESYYPLFEKLFNLKFIVQPECDEKKIYKNYYVKYRNNRLTSNDSLMLTILPTINCNFACRYCFQDENDSNRKITEKTETDIIQFIEKQAKLGELKKIRIIWFGGEPLLQDNVILKISESIIHIAKKYNISYWAEIITNGYLINGLAPDFFSKCNIRNVQITLDGSKDTHDKRRPLKGQNIGTYEKIIKNINTIPEGVNITIRVNCDRAIWDNIDKLFDDLEKSGIWPQRAKSTNIDLAYITKHNNSRFKDYDWYFNFKEFCEIKEKFREFKLERYNHWAELNNITLAKLSFQLPKLTFSDCPTATYPYAFVIDNNGYIYKCWDYADKIEKKVMHITDDFNQPSSSLSKWLNVDRYYSKMCHNCKFIPICDSICAKEHTEDKINLHCCSWKYNLEGILRNQYIEKLEHPGKIGNFTK